MTEITAPAIDRKPGQPEVYYLDHPTRERVIAKRAAVKEVAAPAQLARKAAKKATKKG